MHGTAARTRGRSANHRNRSLEAAGNVPVRPTPLDPVLVVGLACVLVSVAGQVVAMAWLGVVPVILCDLAGLTGCAAISWRDGRSARSQPSRAARRPGSNGFPVGLASLRRSGAKPARTRCRSGLEAEVMAGASRCGRRRTPWPRRPLATPAPESGSAGAKRARCSSTGRTASSRPGDRGHTR